MSQQIIVNCDLCGKNIRFDSTKVDCWKSNEFSLNIQFRDKMIMHIKTAQLPKDVCKECGITINEAILEAIKSRKK